MNVGPEKSLSDLKNGNNSAYEMLYKENYASVERFITNNNGTVDDAKDNFQDTLVVFFKKIQEDEFELTSSLQTYIRAISKNLWFKKLRERSYQKELGIDEHHSDKFFCQIETALLNEKTYWERLQEYLTKISSHCNHLLKSMFFKQRTIDEIRLEYGYSSKHNAQNQKHKCLQQVRKIKDMKEGV